MRGRVREGEERGKGGVERGGWCIEGGVRADKRRRRVGGVE